MSTETMTPEGAEAGLATDKTVVSYVLRYGGMCRDCADEVGVCPRSGLPCAGAEKAVRHVLAALSYGIEHGLIASPFRAALPHP